MNLFTFAPRNPHEAVDNLQETLKKSVPDSDRDVAQYLQTHIDELLKALRASDAEPLRCYSSFLPPRLVSSAAEAQLIPFFGSGISMAAGIPTWGGLLEQLGVASDDLADPQLEHDPLTQAELLAHTIGADALQAELRQLTQRVTVPTLSHRLLALLRLPAYITTNYDCLFETAWDEAWPVTRKAPANQLIVIRNDLDVFAHKLHEATALRRTILIKLHGDAKDDSTHLILARSDYRRHYRSNPELFRLINRLMLSGVLLFVGFSHRDPEASRLVEDVVYEYEKGHSRPPTLYSLQFDMRQRTPEVFAARGIVALRPPAILSATLSPEETRSAAVATELAELVVAMSSDAHSAIDLQAELEPAVQKLGGALDEALTRVGKAARKIEKLRPDESAEPIVQKLADDLIEIAGQGVYLTRANGDIRQVCVGNGLDANKRNRRKNFSDRPYFRQAKTFRTPFVSDVIESIYNDHGTIFLCWPLGNAQEFHGLLFAAVQPGAWRLPLDVRDELHRKGIEMVLVDSNGISLLLPHGVDPTKAEKFPEGEDEAMNVGFPYHRLRSFSRRDVQVAHVTKNIVPVASDDDIYDVAPDLRLFSMVAPVRKTRWKLALSRSVPPARMEEQKLRTRVSGRPS